MEDEEGERDHLTAGNIRDGLRRVDSPGSFGSFLSNTCCGVLNGVSALVIILILNVIPILMIVFGFYNRDNCPADSKIPTWMIVFGITTLTMTVIKFVMNFLNRENSSHRLPLTALTLLQGVISCFNCVWFILGTIWVYSVYSKISYERGANYCDQLTYLFAFINITLAYVFLGIACILLACCCCCACFLVANEDNDPIFRNP